MNRENTVFAISSTLLLLMVLLTPTSFSVKGEAPIYKKAKWTFIVYMDADNNLEGAGIHDLNEMETVGSSDDVSIVVLMDRAIGEDTSNGDWKDSKIFYVTKDGDTETINSSVVKYCGELNMGDPNTLINFTNWAIDSYPAEKYVLDIWDHGGAFLGAAWDDGAPNTTTGEDWLDLDNISSALVGIKEHLGKNLDIVGFDACLMSAASVMYSLYGYTDIVVASGPVEPGDGWPYEKILKSLVEKPTMSPVDLAKEIVTDYVESYKDFKGDPTDSPKVTMAAWYMDKMMPVFSAVNALGMALATNSGMPPDGMIVRLYAARDKSHSYDMYAIAGINLDASYPMYDVYDLAGQLLKGRTITDTHIIESAKETRRVIEDANIISSAGLLPQFADIYGLSVYFPTGERNIQGMKIGPASPYSLRYDTTQWAKEQFWDDFLKSYWVPHVSATDIPPAIYFDGGNSIRFNESCKNCTMEIRGTAYAFSGDVKVFISIDNQQWQEIPTEQNGNNVMWKYSLNILKQKYGNHTIKLKAVDSSSRESPVISRQVTITSLPIQEAPPTINIVLSIVLLTILVLMIASFFIYKKKRRAKK